MSELVALRVKIGRHFNGKQMQNKYPNFNSLPESVRGDMDWSCYIDQFTCWHYDKVSGFGESDAYSPDERIQYGVFCVPQDFADAAIAAFGPSGTTEPGLVEQISEVHLQQFYDERAHEHEAEIRYDEGALAGLRARYGQIPVVKKQIVEFFTDTTEAEAEARIAEFEAILGRPLTAKERAKAEKLCEMEPSDCKAINPDHPSPGVRKNKNRRYADFKNRKGFTIKAL
jgi:hypothetical protein